MEFGAECNNLLVNGISLIEKLSFNALNEETILLHYFKMNKRLSGLDMKMIGADTSYASNSKRLCERGLCKDDR